MRKIATPTDLDAELKSLLRVNRQGASREGLEAAIRGVADRLSSGQSVTARGRSFKDSIENWMQNIDDQLSNMALQIVTELQSASDVWKGPGPAPKYNPYNPDGWETEDDIKDDRPYKEALSLLYEMQRALAKAKKKVWGFER